MILVSNWISEIDDADPASAMRASLAIASDRFSRKDI